MWKCCCSDEQWTPSCVKVIRALICLSLLLGGYSTHPAFHSACITLPLKGELWVFTCFCCAAMVEYPESLFIWNKKWYKWTLYSWRVEEHNADHSKSLQAQLQNCTIVTLYALSLLHFCPWHKTGLFKSYSPHTSHICRCVLVFYEQNASSLIV